MYCSLGLQHGMHGGGDALGDLWASSSAALGPVSCRGSRVTRPVARLQLLAGRRSYPARPAGVCSDQTGAAKWAHSRPHSKQRVHLAGGHPPRSGTSAVQQSGFLHNNMCTAQHRARWKGAEGPKKVQCRPAPLPRAAERVHGLSNVYNRSASVDERARPAQGPPGPRAPPPRAATPCLGRQSPCTARAWPPGGSRGT